MLLKKSFSPDNLSSERLTARRPALFRALGPEDPPDEIDVAGRLLQRLDVLKYDSWAATAVYMDGQGRKVSCKFNRVYPLLRIPIGWLGRWLAHREQTILRLMDGIDGFPRWSGPVTVRGRNCLSAVAHDWIEGQSFKPWLPVNRQFFPRLRAMVARLHEHNIAYVDMSKWENILIGADGHPYLLDYQIHFRLAPHWPLRWCLRLLQGADLYFLHRHWFRACPEQFSPQEHDRWARPPLGVRVAEALGPLWRGFRIRVLRLFGVRHDPRRTNAQESASRQCLDGNRAVVTGLPRNSGLQRFWG